MGEYRVIECLPEFPFNDGDDAAWLFGCAAVVRTVIFVSLPWNHVVVGYMSS